MPGLESAGVTAALVTSLMVLVRVVEKLIDKRKQKNNGENQEHCGGGLTQEQENKLNKLFTMHDRYDDDGVPRWYVPHELRVNVSNMSESMKEHFTEDRLNFERIYTELSYIKAEQSLINNRINDLITSQNRLVDRLGDLITRLDKKL